MTWKRLVLAILLTIVAIPGIYSVAKWALTEWYMRTEPHGDGQLGMSIFFGSAYIALMGAALVFSAALFVRRRPR